MATQEATQALCESHKLLGVLLRLPDCSDDSIY